MYASMKLTHSLLGHLIFYRRHKACKRLQMLNCFILILMNVWMIIVRMCVLGKKGLYGHVIYSDGVTDLSVTSCYHSDLEYNYSSRDTGVHHYVKTAQVE